MIGMAAMTAMMLAGVEAILRTEGRHAVGGGKVPWIELLATVAAGGFTYGLFMGTYALKPLQPAYSGVKVPLLLGVSTAICIPSFYVVNALLGLRSDFVASLRAVLAAQATLAVCLASLAPLIVVFYLSVRDYPLATLANGLPFAIAAGAGQAALGRHYRPLIRANPRHRIAKYAWLVLYIFVAVQMAWVLRPFVGSPDLPTRFFREDAWSNAYLEILDRVLRVLGAG